tara:strand:- start:226 stop:444 length:219 start_codon:yes stop_codon:yes gene_type:complete
LIKAKATRDSLNVWALDDAYGVKLFTRRDGTTKLTNVGQGLFSRTQELFAAEGCVCDYLDKSEKLDIRDIHI